MALFVNPGKDWEKNMSEEDIAQMESQGYDVTELRAKRAKSAEEEEKEEAKKDMGRMLDYIDKLNELDTTGVEPMSHVFPVNNVFREDVVTNGDDRDEILANAPAKKDGAFMVPKTVEQEAAR